MAGFTPEEWFKCCLQRHVGSWWWKMGSVSQALGLPTPCIGSDAYKLLEDTSHMCPPSVGNILVCLQHCSWHLSKYILCSLWMSWGGLGGTWEKPLHSFFQFTTCSQALILLPAVFPHHSNGYFQTFHIIYLFSIFLFPSVCHEDRESLLVWFTAISSPKDHKKHCGQTNKGSRQ